ncbi:hypothetical protein L7F22_048200 [Adiantum nelumboides]|nr:hypothetical protein [Adiantum nelumboides]
MEGTPSRAQAHKKRKNESRRGDEGVHVNPKKLAKEAEEAHRLERLLFGSPNNLDFGHEIDLQDEALPDQDYLGDVENEQRRPVWEDEEEDKTKINLSHVNRLRKLIKVGEDGILSGREYVSRLRDYHAKLNLGSDWARLPSERKKRRQHRVVDSDSDNASDIDDEHGYDDDVLHALRSADELVVKNKGKLPSGLLGVSRLRDANADEPSNAVIHSVQFHRNAQILLTAGYDKRLRFFQIDGKRNPKVQSIFLDDYPVLKAAFVPDGSRVIASGRRRFYYVYDMNAGTVEKMEPLFGREEKSLESFEISPDGKTIAFLGNEGYILLTSSKSRQLVGTLKMNGSVRALSFAKEGHELLSLGGDGEVYHWDVGSRRCIHRGRDDGCFKGTTVSVSHDSSLFATGSNSGVVNLYNRQSFTNGKLAPVKSFMNLVTSVDTLKFNADSQILAMTSKMKKNAVKLVHLPSNTVFSNWPTMKTPLHYVQSLDFSPGGGYLAVGNAAGKVLLYRLQHYERA